MSLEYTAFCLDCGEEIDKGPNGVWVEGAARAHIKQIRAIEQEKDTYTEDHMVLVGYLVTVPKGGTNGPTS